MTASASCSGRFLLSWGPSKKTTKFPRQNQLWASAKARRHNAWSWQCQWQRLCPPLPIPFRKGQKLLLSDGRGHWGRAAGTERGMGGSVTRTMDRGPSPHRGFQAWANAILTCIRASSVIVTQDWMLCGCRDVLLGPKRAGRILASTRDFMQRQERTSPWKRF